MQTQSTAAQSVQQMLASEQKLLAQRGATQEVLEQIDRELASVRAALQGVRLGQELAAEAAAQENPEDL